MQYIFMFTYTIFKLFIFFNKSICLHVLISNQMCMIDINISNRNNLRRNSNCTPENHFFTVYCDSYTWLTLGARYNVGTVRLSQLLQKNSLMFLMIDSHHFYTENNQVISNNQLIGCCASSD